MLTLTKKEFKKLALAKRYFLLTERGEFVGDRAFGANTVKLYSYSGYFVEVWLTIATNQVMWIEVQENETILSSYVTSVDLSSLLE